MKVRLEQIQQDEPFSWEEILSVSGSEMGRPELVALSPVTCRGTVQATDAGYLLRAKLDYTQTLACDRCLAERPEDTRAELELMIETAPDTRSEAELELEEDDFGVLHLDGEVLDTEPLVVEQILLSIPMKPLCRPDCKGLCPHCGADLNSTPCGCAAKVVDPRWAALEALRDRLT